MTHIRLIQLILRKSVIVGNRPRLKSDQDTFKLKLNSFKQKHTNNQKISIYYCLLSVTRTSFCKIVVSIVNYGFNGF